VNSIHTVETGIEEYYLQLINSKEMKQWLLY
jgi:hypothetical protein